MTGSLAPFSAVLAVASRRAVAPLIRWDGSTTARRNAAAAVAADRLRADERVEVERALAAVSLPTQIAAGTSTEDRLPA